MELKGMRDHLALLGTKKYHVILFWILLICFIVITALVAGGKTTVFDTAFQNAFFGLRNVPAGKGFAYFFGSVTFFGDPKTVVVICVLLFFVPLLGALILKYFGKRNRREAAETARPRAGRAQRHKGSPLAKALLRFFWEVGAPVAVTTGVGAVVQTLLKYAIARPRPDQTLWLVPESGYSFPSGHSNGSLILYMFLAILIGRWLILHAKPVSAMVLRIVLAVLVVFIGLSRIFLGVHYPTDIIGGWLLGSALLTLFLILYDTYWPKRLERPLKN